MIMTMEQSIPLARLAEETASRFQDHYGRGPRWMAAAPGRVNLIGEHTDYNDGFVLPMAIERYTVLAADRAWGKPDHERAIAWHCDRLQQTERIFLQKPVAKSAPKHWSNYVRGVLEGLQAYGMKLEPLDVLMNSTVPLGGGLSSSAALEVATATLIEAVSGQRLDPVEKALLCQKAEHVYAGMPCGIMDQFTSTLGEPDHLLLLDCRSRKTVLVPMTSPEVSVLIVNTNVKHELVGGEYAQRRQQCETAARLLGLPSLRDATSADLDNHRASLEPVTARRARHVISEIERTLKTAEALRAGQWQLAGQFMYASHASLRDDFEVSCAELDAVVDIAQSVGVSGGVYGCRMTGGGFGGCAVALVRHEALGTIAQQIADGYTRKTGLQATFFMSRPAAGAQVLKGAC
jgi:galactokinase